MISHYVELHSYSRQVLCHFILLVSVFPSSTAWQEVVQPLSESVVQLKSLEFPYSILGVPQGSLFSGKHEDQHISTVSLCHRPYILSTWLLKEGHTGPQFHWCGFHPALISRPCLLEVCQPSVFMWTLLVACFKDFLWSSQFKLEEKECFMSGSFCKVGNLCKLSMSWRSYCTNI